MASRVLPLFLAFILVMGVPGYAAVSHPLSQVSPIDTGLDLFPFNVTANYFIGDGSQLTGVAGLWGQSGDDIHYTDGSVGIGTTNFSSTVSPHGARFAVQTENNGDEFAVFKDSQGDQIFGFLGLSDNSGLFTIHDGAGSETIRLRGSNGAESFINSGNVGIGTTEPTQRLHVAGGQINISQSGGPRPAVRFVPDDQDAWNIVANSRGLSFHDTTDAQYRLVADQDGNVGIGTANPDAVLDVHNSAGSEIFSVASNGVLQTSAHSNDDNRIGRLYINYHSNGNPAIESKGTGDNIYFYSNIELGPASELTSPKIKTGTVGDIEIRHSRSPYGVEIITDNSVSDPLRRFYVPGGNNPNIELSNVNGIEFPDGSVQTSAAESAAGFDWKRDTGSVTTSVAGTKIAEVAASPGSQLVSPTMTTRNLGTNDEIKLIVEYSDATSDEIVAEGSSGNYGYMWDGTTFARIGFTGSFFGSTSKKVTKIRLEVGPNAASHVYDGAVSALQVPS